MKKSLLMLCILFVVNVVYASFTDEIEDSNGWVNNNEGNWTQTATAGDYIGNSIYSKKSKAHSGDRKIGFNDIGDWLQLPDVDNPVSMTYWARLSTNESVANGNRIKVQVFSGGSWVDIIEHTTTTVTYSMYSADLSAYSALANVKVRLFRSADNRSHYIDDIAVVTSVLPITLLSFSGKNIDTDVNLSWTTVQEVNNKFFTLERSNGKKRFNVIGMIDGAGDSDTYQNYSFIDDAPLSGDNFYRLKQTDLDGAFSYSEVIVVRSASNTSGVNPTLVNDITKIQFEKVLTKDVKFLILNISGQIVYSGLINKGYFDYKLNAINFNPGTYFVRFDDSSYSTLRFVKL